MQMEEWRSSTRAWNANEAAPSVESTALAMSMTTPRMLLLLLGTLSKSKTPSSVVCVKEESQKADT